jgi:hypothetical protein
MKENIIRIKRGSKMIDPYHAEIIVLVLADAANKRMDAGYSGGWDDGGASRLEEQAKFFAYGLNRVMPPEWNQFIKQYETSIDPEYQEFLRLQKKFSK